jgi:hypothetical protein
VIFGAVPRDPPVARYDDPLPFAAQRGNPIDITRVSLKLFGEEGDLVLFFEQFSKCAGYRGGKGYGRKRPSRRQ